MDLKNDIPSDVKTSQLLRDTLNSLTSNSISIGELLKQFQRRSYGGVFLILALLAILPGISVLAGMALLVPAFQLLLGYPAPIFPKAISQKKISAEGLKKYGFIVVKWIEKLEHLVKPRLPQLTSPIARRIIGLTIFLLAIVVAIPFPFSNFPPAVATIGFALALLERDGVMVVLASVISFAAFTIGFTVFYLIFNWLSQFL